MSAALQEDNPAQKEALRYLIDAVAAAGGTIRDDWTCKTMTADEAKRYVMSGGNAEDERGRKIGLNFLRALARRNKDE